MLGGGPDGFGYTYLSTQDGDLVNFNFIDISTSGTPLGAGDDWCSGSDASTLYYLGFSFPYYMNLVDSISICSNGTIILGNRYSYVGLSNGSLPDNYYAEAGFIAVMWDDLDPSSGGDVYFQSFASCPDGYTGACAVVQWDSVPLYGGSIPMTFEAILYDNGYIKLQYNSTVDYNDATVGIQDSTAAAGLNPTWYLQYVYNSLPPSHIPGSGVAILFKRPVFSDYDVSVISITPSGPVDVAPVNVVARVFNLSGVSTTSTRVYLNIYDTVSNALVFSDTQTVAIPSMSGVNVTFNTFTPSPRSFYMAEVIVAEPMDTVHTNDTLRGYFRTYLIFGDVVGSWTFPSLGDGTGYSFAGITYAPDSGKFYVVSMNPGATVFRFDPNNPAATFSPTTWMLHLFFGVNDIPWGIAYVNGNFWVSHVGYNPSSFSFIGNKMGIYDGDGNLIDSFDIWTNIESGSWMAGLDHDVADNVVFGVYVGGSNNIYKIDPTTYLRVGTFPNYTGTSQRGIAVFPEVDEVYYGGWNSNKVYKLQKSTTTLLDSADMNNMADMDIWLYCPDTLSPIYAFITLNDANNTLIKMATGHYCNELGVSERVIRELEVKPVKVLGRTVFYNGCGEIYDISGRRVATFNGRYIFKRSGVFFVKTGKRVIKVVIR